MSADIDPRCPGCGEPNPAHCHCGDIDDNDPGPHTCIFVGVDNHDECEICGRDSNQFRDLTDEWDLYLYDRASA